MWNSTPRNKFRRYLIGILAGLPLAGLLSCERLGGGAEKPEGVDAGTAPTTKLTDLKGTVEWRSGPDGKWKPVEEGQAVDRGDGLRAGAGARYTLVFPDGRQIRIEGQGQVGLAEHENEAALLMKQGEVEVAVNRVEGRQYHIIFANSSDVILLREGRAGVKMKADGVQVEMIMGSATINRGGETTPLQAGQSFVLDIGAGKITNREELTTTLLDRKRRSRIRPPGQKKFRRPRKRKMKLEPGTALITRRSGSVELVDDSGSRVELGARSRAVFEGTFRSETGRESTIKLDYGEAKIHLRRGKKGGAIQRLIMPMGTIVARARGMTAEVTVRSRGKSTQVTVYTGNAEVAVGDQTVTVGPGQSLNIGKKGKIGKLEPLKLPKIRVREGVRARVFYDRRIRRVALTWKGGKAEEELLLEISPTPDFKKPTLRQPVAGKSYILSNVRPGKYFWRLTRPDGNPGRTGSLAIRRDPIARQLASDKLTNVIPDTGIKTTIYFQGKVPALTFEWDAVETAAGYKVRIYSEDDMEKPILEETAEETRLVLPAGKLKEGTYFWYQSASDSAGQEIKASQMNKLSLAFDNATPLLRLEAPKPGQKPEGGRVEVSGLAPPGSRVVVGKNSIEISPDGRFKQTLSGIKRRAVLIFKLSKKGAGDVYYVRHLR
jgi:ferric-dicitrate binding protein FerR (iron transport regulator)